MGNELNVKVGDKLLFSSGYSYNRRERIVEVTKITPTGRIRINDNDSQYDKYGRELGANSLRSRSFLSIPTQEDYKRIKKNNAISKVRVLITELNTDNLTYEEALKIIEVLESIK